LSLPRSGLPWAGLGLAALLLVATVSCRRSDPEPAAGERRDFSFTSAELRSDRPGLALVSVDGAVSEDFCEWLVHLRGAGRSAFAGEVVVTVRYRSGSVQHTARFATALDLGPGEDGFVRGLTRPGRPVDAVERVEVRFVAALSRSTGTPRPLH
jgi:hypothetical protein